MSAAVRGRRRSSGSTPPEYAVPVRRSRRCWEPRVDRHKDCVVVRVEGEMDASCYPELTSVLERAVRSCGRAVVLDLRPTRFLSIRAATMLGAIKQRAAGDGSDLRLVAGRHDVERVLEVTGVRPMFRRYPSMRAALED